MNIVLITQNEPFYLGRSIEYFLEILPVGCHVSGVVLLSASPFGKKMNALQKGLNTLEIFGLAFTIYYFVRLIASNIFGKRVESVLKKNKIPIIKLEESINSPRSLEKIISYKPDLLISIQGNEIFKEGIINLAPKGCLNLHTALLPKYRGLMPTFWVLKNRERKTGVSVFFVDKGIDSGPILVQREVEINNLTQAQLIEITKKIGIECIVEGINKICSGSVEVLPNDDDAMTYYGFPTKSDVRAFRDKGGKFF